MINENSNDKFIDFREVTVLLSVFNFNIQEMDYWKNTFLSLKEKGVKVQVLVDKPSLKNECEKWFENIDVFVNKKNLGKLASVYWHVRDGKIKTKYFKSVDPDDYLSVERFINQKKILKNNDYIIIDEILFLEKSIDNYEEIDNIANQLEEKSRLPISFANSSMIIPVEPIKRDTFFKRRKKLINFAEDQILGIICLINNAEVLYRKKEESSPFYLYVSNNGYSNQSNPEMNKLICKELVIAMGYWIKLMKNQPNEILKKNNWPQYDIINANGRGITKLKNDFSKMTYYKYVYFKRRKKIIKMLGM